MTQAHLPVVGAALRLQHLPEFIDWLVADQRDCEIQDPAYTGYLDTDWAAEARRGRELLTAHGYRGRLGIHAAFDGIDLGTRDTMLRQVFQNRYLQSLDFGRVIGATHMVIHSPFYMFGNPFAQYTPGTRQAIIDATHAALTDVLPVAQGMGCRLVIETIQDTNVYPLLELVKSFNSEFVRFSIDTGHAFIMHQQLGGAPPDQWVYEGGELLEHVHLQDVDGNADRHWGLGEGNINWRSLFRALGTLQHRPRLILELLQKDDILPSAHWLAAQGLAR